MGFRSELLRIDNNRAVHLIRCGCGAEGELTLDRDDRTPTACPEGCGTVFIQWSNPLKGGRPDLMAVVEPVFVEARSCRVCGCTDEDCRGCIERTGRPCHWVEDDLCSACLPPARPARSPRK